jgi:hypothetical protein
MTPSDLSVSLRIDTHEFDEAMERATARLREFEQAMRGVIQVGRGRSYLGDPTTTLTMPGSMWRRFPFAFKGERDPLGHLVGRCDLPLIGSAALPYHPLFLPHGWTAPLWHTSND